MSLLDHIRRCNSCDPAQFRPFEVAGRTVGQVHTGFAARLAAFPDLFDVSDDRVILYEHFADAASRSAAIAAATNRLYAVGALPKARGESFPVLTAWGREPLLVIDRAHVSAFGLRAFGLHVNGFRRDGDRLILWIGRRALDKMVEPGKLDNMIAGGQPAGLSLRENLLKEGAEEADLPPVLAALARPAGALSYRMEGELGLKPDTLFVYDLEVPADFVPRNTDGEISEFFPMDAEEVLDRLRRGRDFKFNVALVLIDFLIRHGVVTPENEPDYLALVNGLRVDLGDGAAAG